MQKEPKEDVQTTESAARPFGIQLLEPIPEDRGNGMETEFISFIHGTFDHG